VILGERFLIGNVGVKSLGSWEDRRDDIIENRVVSPRRLRERGRRDDGL